MKKNEMIARLKTLSGELGRDIDTAGTEAELELRLREVEEEYSVIRDDDVIRDVTLISEGEIPPGSSVTHDNGESLKIRVKPGNWSLHLRVLTARGWVPSLVSPGATVVIAGQDFDAKTMTKGG